MPADQKPKKQKPQFKGPPPPRTFDAIWQRYAFWGILVLCTADILWVIWGSRYFILQDLPDHIARASILKDFWLSPYIRHYFRLAPFPVPYIACDILNAALLSVFDSYAVIKIFATVSALILIGGVGYFVRRTARSQPELVLFPFAILWANVFLKGNLNFIVGVGALFFVLGIWWPHRWNCSRRREAALALGGILLYCTHLIAIFMMLFIAGISFLLHCGKTKTFEYKKLWPALPAIAIIAAYFAWNGSGGETMGPVKATIPAASGYFLEKYHSISSFFNVLTGSDWHLFVPLMALLLVWVLVSLRHSIRTEESIVLLALTGMFLLAPNELHGMVIRPDERILFILFLWALSLVRFPQKGKSWCRYSWILIILAPGLIQSAKIKNAFKEWDAESSPYVTLMQQVPPHCLVCDLVYFERHTFIHFYKLLIPEKQDVVPGLFDEKNDCIRYRQPLPNPPIDPIVTDSLLRIYDYFIAHGMSEQIVQVVQKRKLSVVWCTEEIALLRSNIKTAGE